MNLAAFGRQSNAFKQKILKMGKWVQASQSDFASRQRSGTQVETDSRHVGSTSVGGLTPCGLFP